MRFLNLILILLMWTEAVFAVSTTDNNKVIGKTLKVALEYVTSMSKIDGSFESGNTGWVASVGTITPTASTEFQGNYKGLWSATGAGTLDLQWTATASNTYEASAIVSVDGADSDHYVCAVVNGVETGCTLFDGPDYTPNKQIKVSVVADSVKGASFYLRIKHTGTDAFNLSIDDGKIQPWTAQTVQTVEQDSAGFSSGSTAVGNITFSSYGVKTGNLFTASGTRLTLNKDCYFVGQANSSGAAGTVYIRRYNQAGTLLESASSSYSTSGDRSASFTKFVNAGDYFLIYTDFINTAIAFNATCSVNRNNVVQAWQDGTNLTNMGTLSIGAITTAPTKGTTVQDLVQMKRLGDMAYFSYQYKQTTAGTAGTGDYLVSLPNGMSFDSTKTTFYTGARYLNALHSPIGLGHVQTSYANATSANEATGVIVPYDATRFRVFSLYTITAPSNSAGVGYFWGEGNALNSPRLTMNITFMAPIQGWSSAPTLYALPTRSEIFSANVSIAGVVTNATQNFVTSCTNAAPSVCTLWSNFGVTPICWATPIDITKRAEVTTSSTTSLTVGRTDISTAFNLFCHLK